MACRGRGGERGREQIAELLCWDLGKACGGQRRKNRSSTGRFRSFGREPGKKKKENETDEILAAAAAVTARRGGKKNNSNNTRRGYWKWWEAWRRIGAKATEGAFGSRSSGHPVAAIEVLPNRRQKLANGGLEISVERLVAWLELQAFNGSPEKEKMPESFCHEEDQEDQFFDTRDDISSASSSCPGSPAGKDSPADGKIFCNWALNDPYSTHWMKDPDSVRTRRSRFMQLMGLDQVNLPYQSEEVESDVDDEDQLDTGRASLESGAELRSSSSENTFSMSSWSSEEMSTSYDDESFEENFMCRIKNLDDGTIFVANKLGKDGKLRSLREIRSNRTVELDEFERILGSSSLIQRLMRKESSVSVRSDKSVSSNSDNSVRGRRISWLKRLGAVAGVVDRHRKEIHSNLSRSNKTKSSTSRIIKVNVHGKPQKELSAVFKTQDIKGHDGAILTMKFSPDGQYLATGGEDGVVRVWHVSKSQWTQDLGIPQDDSPYIYFKMNHSSELHPAHSDYVEKIGPKESKKSSTSACVVIPPEVFRLSTEPIHEFRGHDGHVLDLSWSNSKYLLSSSVDKTVRLWRIGSQTCMKVFPHNNYVTCVQFNPIEENFFISGSIDGKVRIWEISGCNVVHWADVREIVTAICYRPDGKGAVVGTLEGNCRFYDTSDNHLEIDDQLALHGKKSSFKRITSFQFCPSNPRKLMVISADSKIHILEGVNVVAKFKGPRSSGSQASASFTADGQHIISSSEDSKVFIWNHHDLDIPISNHVKSKYSFERFSSANTLVAIPWHGFESSDLALSLNALDMEQEVSRLEVGGRDCNCHVEHSFGFTLSHESFSGFMPKGSATWPEEKLPPDSAASTLCQSDHKFLKNSCQYNSHAWGQVIVTAGWDGWIRSYQNFGLPLSQ